MLCLSDSSKIYDNRYRTGSKENQTEIYHRSGQNLGFQNPLLPKCPLTTVEFSFHSLQNCSFLNHLKYYRIESLCKKGNINCLDNFRPIVIFSSLYHPIFNRTRFIIVENQHGFMNNQSTTTNLSITKFISIVFSIHSQVDVIYTHFSKALIRKLEQLGFVDPLCDYLGTYFCNRAQFVECNDHASTRFQVSSNDIEIKLGVDPLLCADLLKIYKVINNLSDFTDL